MTAAKKAPVPSEPLGWLRRRVAGLATVYRSVPVFIAGLYPARGSVEGSYVAILTEYGGDRLAEGSADAQGVFRSRIPRGKRTVQVVVRHAGLVYDSDMRVMVERWGLFLPVKQRIDEAYIGSNKVTDWQTGHEFARATNLVQVAIRHAKLTWWFGPLNVAATLGSGAGGFVLSPALGFLLGVLVFVVLLAVQAHLSRGSES